MNLIKFWKKIIISIDQVKLSLQYQRVDIVGLDENSEKIAKTVLGIMIKCLHAGPKFLIKMIAVAKLESEFLFEKVTCIVNFINRLNGHSEIAIKCDNNRLNQTFFSGNLTLTKMLYTCFLTLFISLKVFTIIGSRKFVQNYRFFFSTEITAKWKIVKRPFEHEKVISLKFKNQHK